jgi:radical SAM protein with 4Fe4S-binding SPASM domain
MSFKNKDTFCILPWNHLNVQPNGDIYQCCMAPYGEKIGNTKEDTLEEVWNGEDMKGIRKDMLDGRRPHLCNRCFLIEDSGLTSPRGTHNRMFNKDIEKAIKDTNPDTGEYPEFKLKYWDFRWSNICNFKCRMCGVYSSSKWYEEAKELHNETIGNNGITQFNSESKEDVFKMIDKNIYDVEEIYFAGGEPLVMEEHYLVLEKLIAAGRTDVRLRYNTNFSHLKFRKWDLFGLWQKFLDNPKGGIQLFASLDAVGKLAEVIRNGTKWDKIYQNIKKCKEAGMEVHFSPTVSLLNMFFIDELIDLAADVKIDNDKVNVNNLLTTPSCYDIRLLPDYLKKQLIDKLEHYLNTKCPEYYKPVVAYGLPSWVNFINEPFTGDREKEEQTLLTNTLYLDTKRNENFLEVNPQYKDWFTSIETRLNEQGREWKKLPSKTTDDKVNLI